MGAEVARYLHDQQVRRRADRGGHSAEQSAEADGHENRRRRDLVAHGDADEHRQQHDDDRRVVDERAQYGACKKRNQACGFGVSVPGLGEPQCNGLQCSGRLEAFAQDHERADRDERLVAEAGQEPRRRESLARVRIGIELKEDDQADQNRQRRRFQRNVVASK